MGVGSPQVTKPSLAFCGNLKMRQVTHEAVFFFYLSLYLFAYINGSASNKQAGSELTSLRWRRVLAQAH